jgi:hypothetical protein
MLKVMATVGQGSGRPALTKKNQNIFFFNDLPDAFNPSQNAVL